MCFFRSVAASRNVVEEIKWQAPDSITRNNVGGKEDGVLWVYKKTLYSGPNTMG